MHVRPERGALRIGILTGTEIRHRYFVQAVRSRWEVVAAGYEQTGYSPAAVSSKDLTPAERIVVDGHFAERARQEQRFFGHASDFVIADGRCAARHIGPGALNSEATLVFLQAAGVDTVVVYGTNLIRPPLIEHWPGRLINMHLGLSPYYRGTATNFYPLLNEEPQFVGATIHLIDPGIDTGPILRHARPRIDADDMPHTIGCRAIQAGIDALHAVLDDLAAGTVKPVRQWTVAGARLYLRKDYHPRQIVDLYRKLEDGLIPKYVQRAGWASAGLRLIESSCPVTA